MLWKKINQFLTGNSEPWSFNFKEVFSLSFKKHKKDTVIQKDDFSAMPHPWIWLRAFLFLLTLSFVYYTIVYSGGVILAFPWFALVTASIIPITVAIFLFESNIKESISLINIIFVFFAGNALSFAALIYINLNVGIESINTAFIAPFIEELAKLLPIIIAISLLKIKRLSSAIFIGWLVGAGFEIAETLGYSTFLGFAEMFSETNMAFLPDPSTLIERSLYAFGSHALFGAIEGAAFLLSQKRDNIKFNKKRFVVWISLSIIFHMAWNSNVVFNSSPNLTIIICVILQVIMIGVFIFLYDACIRDNKLTSQEESNVDIKDIIMTENEKSEFVN
jgi:RsiW-degrading membrane proteinase PrsW (M82 family)